MSRGLGINQRLFLAALKALHEDHGADVWFRASAVAGEAYRLSDALQEHHAAIEHDRAEWRADIEARAKEGDSDCRRLLLLTDLIASNAKPTCRIDARHRHGLPRWFESKVNPSRVTELLARRGLVERFRGYLRLTVTDGSLKRADP
jgi:hypothetical protein